MYKLFRFCASLHHVGKWVMVCLPWAWAHCGVEVDATAAVFAAVEDNLYEDLLQRCNALESSSRRLNPYFLAVTAVHNAVLTRVCNMFAPRLEAAQAEEVVAEAIHATIFHISLTAQGVVMSLLRVLRGHTPLNLFSAC